MEQLYKETLERLTAELKKQLPEIEANGDWLWHHPETGFKEIQTQQYCLDVLKKHGFEARTWPDVTGFTCTLDTGRPGPCVMIMGEMDSLICYSHPDCNPETGAAHACGHSIQMATAIGAFLTLAESGVLKNFGGKVMLAGVPAEECLESEWRMQEIKKGRLHFLGGKAELLYRGGFEGVDIVVSLHAGLGNDGTITILGSHNGFTSKNVTFKGRSAHAAADPENGVNALYMANTALTALNSLRETFKDSDTVRVHPIITKGGTVVNAIPEEVCIECQCRAGKMETVMDVSKKFDRAMGAGAYAFGGKAVVNTQLGYLPYRPLKELDQAAAQAADDVLGKGHVNQGGHNCGSTDLGDLNEVIPGIQVFVNYMHGVHHAADYRIADRKIYETASLFLAAMACRLLDDGGALAKKVKEAHKPLFASAEGYCAYVKSLETEQILP